MAAETCPPVHQGAAVAELVCVAPQCRASVQPAESEPAVVAGRTSEAADSLGAAVDTDQVAVADTGRDHRAVEEADRMRRRAVRPVVDSDRATPYVPVRKLEFALRLA